MGAMEVNQVLDTYCQASGQRINYAKSSIFFSKGVPENIRNDIKGILHVPNETLNEKYLGMPSDIGSSKNGAFKYLKDRLWSRIQGWIEKSLST
uniref:Reverse transcriptase domain-containing protein n=1 Tax=Aegilops tauschii subsp. strangulata TaxID=200361 RepID=A0A453M681_AEGTS